MNTRLKTLALALFGFASISRAQGPVTLHIGDKAPEMKYSKWLKGTPVKEYQKDRLYVLEFWATWCGPCKAAMPHLSELAKKYEKEATVIGVNVWEKTGEKPYESSLPEVSRFVTSIGDKMSYNVIADNNDQHMGEKWMKAAGQYGIPCTFVVKNDQILWIGHPMKLDSTMQLVLSGKYDMAGVRADFDRKQKASEAQTAEIRKAFDPVNEAIKAKDYALAVRMIDSGIIKAPTYAPALNNMKFTTLLDHVSADSAIAFAKVWIKQASWAASSVGMSISQKDGLSKEAYLFAAGLLKDAAASPGIVTPLVYHSLAGTYAKAGDYKAAVEAQEKALADAKVALKEGKWLGTILDYTVTDYEKELAGYKKKL
ncbi:redoxin domain-containing protein [Chitinophaga sedimenti]|uniref:redoxin domain-containing protein n=1 Tax=Chitinophaga sedimenti TaxID=2033606 RepID=UPI002006ADCF|nr:redoxin domain-containing protein [Chitinophaga sedimenti]MCK7555649.1 redoxin domain-containing protein [Chitinophaga sedimenti]